MRPVQWQAQAAAAQALEAAGQPQAAERKRSAAEQLVLEIAGGFKDQQLRAAYLRSSLSKLKAR